MLVRMAAQQIKAVLLDADGVLQWPVAGWVDGINALMHNGGTWAELDRREQTYAVTGEQPFPELLREYFDELGETVTVERMIDEWNKIDFWPGSLDLVDQVRAGGVRCYVASNQQAERAAYMRAHGGFEGRFDGEFYSCELGVAKPDAGFFAACLERTRTSPGETLFIDDKQPNVVAAASAGLIAQRIDPADGPAGLARILAAHALIP